MTRFMPLRFSRSLHLRSRVPFFRLAAKILFVPHHSGLGRGLPRSLFQPPLMDDADTVTPKPRARWLSKMTGSR